MEDKRPFNCTKCGLCCSRAPARILIAAHLPVHERGIGCAHLKPDHTCAIYEYRPNICRVDRVYDLVYKDQESWSDYVERQERACESLQLAEKEKK